jgi:hypothetical protein
MSVPHDTINPIKQKEEKMTTHDLDTTDWTSIPFTADGVNYVSKLSPTSPFLAKVKDLPYGAFQKMNTDAVRDLIGTGLTRNEIVEKLREINQSATHAIIDLE